MFAITLVFLFFFFLVTTASLSSFKSHPDKEGFLTTFIKERKLNIERREGRLYRAEVTIAHYDQYSNLEIVVNGHRVFGSFSDCLMSYQCRPQGDQSAIDKLNTLVSLKLTDGSIYNLFSLNSLPKTIDLLHYLTVGTNYVDIYSFNSGLNDCDVEVDTAIYSTNKSHKYNIKITPSDREDDVASYSTDTIEETNETLNSGFRLEEGNTSGLMFPYNTFDYSSFKLCQRVRLVLGLDASQVPYSLDEWRGWALARRNVEVCELFNYDQSGCEKKYGQ